MHVLVVDDDIVTRRFISETLLLAGFRVTAVSDGAAALELFAQQHFSIIFTDRKMPHVDGVQLCREVRKREGSIRHTYIIMVTTCSERDDVLSGLTSGVDDYITKPFDMTELAIRAKIAEEAVARDTRAVTQFTLSKFVELRNVESCGHLDRVSRLTKVLAEELSENSTLSAQIDDEFIESITHASWLHDIGKTAIPEGILLKPGRLTDDERTVVERHTSVAADVFDEAINRFSNFPLLQHASEIARSHHEHFDGSGYPNRLIGEEIPLSARIVAVADVYDALRSKRVYKDAIPHSEAKEYLCDRSGSQFDPLVVNAFIAKSDLFAEILGNDTPDEEESYCVNDLQVDSEVPSVFSI